VWDDARMPSGKRPQLPPRRAAKLDTRRRDATLRLPKPTPRASPARQGSSRAR
jgi:hypothetical protein